MTWFRRGTATMLVGGSGVVAACGGGDGGVEPPIEPPMPPVVAVVALAAADPEPEVGDSVAVTAHVRDASGSPIPSVRIDFATGASSGSVSPTFGMTNADGAVSAIWTVATVPGTQSLAARAGDVGDTLVVTVVSGPPDSVATEWETDFQAEPASAWPVAVVVRDRWGNPTPTVPVVFEVVAGGGAATPDRVETDADGRAASTWTLGTEVGAQRLVVKAGEVGDTLVGTVVSGPPASAVAEGETDFEAYPGNALPVAVVVRDRWDNPAAEVPVVFEVVAGGGAATPGRVETDAEGRAASTWTLGPVVGAHRLLVRAGELEALDFTAATGLAIREAAQERWPESEEITLRGWRMDLISTANVLVNGGPPSSIEVASPTLAVVRPRPLSGAQAEGCAAHRAGHLSVVAPGVGFGAPVRLLHGPLVALEVGQEMRLSGNEHCVRLHSERGTEQYVLAAVERSYIDAARSVSEEWHYDGGEPFDLMVADSTARSTATPGLVARIEPPPDPFARHPDHVRMHPPTASQRFEDVWTRTVPYKVGDEFDWYTGNGRNGTFQVMALYPPNFVLAMFKEDMPTLWNDRRALAMDSLFQDLGSPRIQEMYRTVFGDERAQTSPATGQMLFMFHDGSGADATGVAYTAPNFRETTVHFRHAAFRDDNSWYYGLVAHELGHAWQSQAIGRISAVWSGEGIANWIADERLRLVADLDLDANFPFTSQEIQGWGLRMPETGDFVAGYRESHPFIRFLVTRLVLDHGQSYESAARRVVRGVAEGWWGHHFVNWDVVGYDGGLVSRMREVVPNWDPVEARLDWMVSIALDDRGNLPRYRIPFVRGASQSLRPLLDLRLGSGNSLRGEMAGGGNFYFMVRAQGETGALHLLAPSESTAEGVPTMAWKLVRWR